MKLRQSWNSSTLEETAKPLSTFQCTEYFRRRSAHAPRSCSDVVNSCTAAPLVGTTSKQNPFCPPWPPHCCKCQQQRYQVWLQSRLGTRCTQTPGCGERRREILRHYRE